MIDLSDENIIKKIKEILDKETITNSNLLSLYLSVKRMSKEIDQESITPK